MQAEPFIIPINRQGLGSIPEKIICNILIALVIIFAVTVNAYEGWSSLSTLCAGIFFIFFYVSSRSLYFIKPTFPLVLFTFYSFLSFFWNGSLDYSQQVGTAFLVGMAILFGLKKKVVSIEVVVSALIIASLLNIWCSKDNAVLLGDPDDYRVAGLTGNANALSIFLSFTAFIILYVPMRLPKITKLLGIYFIIYSVLYTGSRKGLFLAVMTLVFGLGSLFVSLGKIRTLKLIRWAILFLFVAIVAVLYVQMWPSFLQQHQDISVFGRTQNLIDGRHNVRFDMISEGFRLWKASPWWGWGAGQFAELTVFRIYSHNNYVETLANYGLIGFLIYYSFYAIFIFTALKKLSSSLGNDKEKLNCSIGLFMLVMTLIAEWGLVTLGGKNPWIFTMIAAYLILDKQGDKDEVRSI